MATRTLQRGTMNTQPTSSRPTASGSDAKARNLGDTARTLPKKPAVFHTPMNRPTSNQTTPSTDASSDRKSQASSSETVQNHANNTPSQVSVHNSLFDEPSASAADILSETNRAAVRRGKQALPTLRVNKPSTSDDELAPGDSISDDDRPQYSMTGWSQYSRRSTPSIRSHVSQEIESKVRGYYSELRRRYVLQRLRAHDLMEYRTSTIPEQDIVIDETNNKIYHVSRPELTQPTYPIEDSEIIKVRSVPQFGEPFTEHDPNPNRRPRPYSLIGLSGFVPNVTLGTNSGNNNNIPPAGPSEFNGNHSGSNGGPGNTNNFNRDLPPHLPNQNNNQNRPSGGPGGDPDGNGPPDDPGDPNGGPPSEDSDDGTGTEREGDRLVNEPRIVAIRQSTAEPTLSGKREWVYDPTPQSEEEMMKAAFKPIETVIKTHLHRRPLKGNAANVQKTLIQSLPKPGIYCGEDNLTIFDRWVQGLVRWLSIANLCGREIRWSYTLQSDVLTSTDIQRVNTVPMFLSDSALQWFHDVVEQIPDEVDSADPLKGRWTFLQVIAGLYRRFIHEASLTKVVDQYEAVSYSKSCGVQGLFNTLKNFAKRLPTPPDAYTFRKRLFLLLPEYIVDTMTTVHKITAERSSLTDIIETAISLEQGEVAHGLGPGLENVNVENALKNVTAGDLKNVGTRRRNRDPQKSSQVFKMTDEDGNTRLFRLAETTNDDSENEKSSVRDDTGDDQIWARYDDASSESDGENNYEHSPDSYGGSQYTSDSELDERTGFMLDYDANNDSEPEDYTNIEIPEQFVGARDDPDSESETQ
ncbi:hypothetical protein L218DRAFT_991057 [Marasmius fiardii PR-910]|nr:hypothetical protein L218DRAFT_991057 [Marasmius fiardii PR-910]